MKKPCGNNLNNILSSEHNRIEGEHFTNYTGVLNSPILFITHEKTFITMINWLIDRCLRLLNKYYSLTRNIGRKQQLYT